MTDTKTNKTLEQYIEETDKLFEEKFCEEDVYKLDIYFADDPGIFELKKFLHERQLGLIELMKGFIPDKDNFPDDKFGKGFNSCREQILKIK